MSYNNGPKIVTNGLVMCLDAGNTKSFRGEPTTNYYDTPETLTTGRTGTDSGGTYTDYTTGGPNGGRFTRWTNNTGAAGSTAWHWQIYYSNTGLSAGQQLNVSFYARCLDGTLSSITLNSPDGVAINGTLTSEWKRFSAVITYGGDYVTTPFVRINRSNSATFTLGAKYDIALLQIEIKTYATNFVVGSRGTTVATGGGMFDLSRNGNHGVLNGGITANNAASGNVVLDGSSGYVSIPALNYPSLSGITVEIVFKSTVASNSGTGFLIWDHSSGNPIWLGKNSSNNWFFMFNNGSSKAKWAYGAASFSANQWIHVVCRLSFSDYNKLENGNFAEILVNNVVASTSYRNDIPTAGYPSGNIWLGRYGTASGNGEIGSGVPNYSSISVGYFKVYNRALSYIEMTANFNAIRNRFGL